jgi:hypothetical protein
MKVDIREMMILSRSICDAGYPPDAPMNMDLKAASVQFLE